jgi:hypothetical protein
MSALFAVTTLFPDLRAASTTSRATPVPPMSSMTTSSSRLVYELERVGRKRAFGQCEFGRTGGLAVSEADQLDVDPGPAAEVFAVAREDLDDP